MKDLCNSLKYLLLHNCMANSAIILHLVCLVCLISHIEKIGQSDLEKNYYFFFVKQADFWFDLFSVNYANKHIGKLQVLAYFFNNNACIDFKFSEYVT